MTVATLRGLSGGMGMEHPAAPSAAISTPTAGRGSRCSAGAGPGALPAEGWVRHGTAPATAETGDP